MNLQINIIGDQKVGSRKSTIPAINKETTLKDCYGKYREIDFKLYSCNKVTKGQLISKCPLGVIVSTKTPTKKFDNFCPGICKVVNS